MTTTLRRSFSHPFQGFHVYSALSAGIWIVVLPFVFFGFGAEKVAQITALIVSFALVYIFIWGSLHYYPRGWLQRARSILALCIVAAFGLLSIPLVGNGASAFLPFVAALLSWMLPIIPAILSIGVLGATIVTISHFLAPESGLILPIDALFWAVVVCCVVQLSRFSQERAQLNQEIELSQQRDSIARDVHDVLGHSLTVISLKSEVARRLVHTNPDAAAAELEAITALSRTSLAEVRSTVTRMRQPDLAGELAAAARAFHTAHIEASLPDDSSGVTTNAKLFSWVIREATTNIIRHSEAENVSIELTPSSVEIIDDGIGFDISDLGCDSSAATTGEGQTVAAGGLAGLKQRVQDAGGDLIIESAPGRGTRLVATMTQSRLQRSHRSHHAGRSSTTSSKNHLTDTTVTEYARENR